MVFSGSFPTDMKDIRRHMSRKTCAIEQAFQLERAWGRRRRSESQQTRLTSAERLASPLRVFQELRACPVLKNRSGSRGVCFCDGAGSNTDRGTIGPSMRSGNIITSDKESARRCMRSIACIDLFADYRTRTDTAAI